MANETVKKVEKSRKAKEKKPNIFLRIVKYFKDIVAELKRVVWPGRKDLITLTGAVIVFVILIAIVIGALDAGFSQLLKLAIGG